jgi:hypothetical protein
MKKLAITVISAAALAAVPALAAADPGHGRGHDQAGPHAQGLGRCGHPQRVAFVARGTLVSYDAATGNIVLNVVRANHHARAFTSGQPLSTTGARLRFRGVTDGNSDGSVGLDDVISTDRVTVIGKLVRPKRGCDGSTSVVLRKVMVSRPGAAQD